MIRIVILVVALTAGGGAAWLAYSALSDENASSTAAEAPEPIGTSAVLVAAQPIDRGERLGPASLQWQDWPASIAAEGAILRDTMPEAIATYTDWTARTSFLPGEPIRPERLVEGHGGLMSVILSPGMRAVAVGVSAETGAGGFVMPDDRVDIVHTVLSDADGDGNDEPLSRTIIRNVRVLAVDQLAGASEEGNAVVANTVTLELTPEQVEALITARNSGRLSLALRSVADFDASQDDMVVQLAPPEPAPATEPEPQQQPAPAPQVQAERERLRIRIIGSGEVETLEVDRKEG